MIASAETAPPSYPAVFITPATVPTWRPPISMHVANALSSMRLRRPGAYFLKISSKNAFIAAHDRVSACAS